tara:strand:- start:456 stop:605 length:150 start_codon:yes stop_codon:yes gene_type:complete
MQNLKIGCFYVESVCKRLKTNFWTLTNMVALGKIRRNRVNPKKHIKIKR